MATSNSRSRPSQPAHFAKRLGDRMAIAALAVVTGLSVLTCLGSQPRKNVPPEILWKIAPGMGDYWNREQHLPAIFAKRRLEDMSRRDVLRLLGQPGYSAVIYPGNTRIDIYRLSAKNDRSYRIDYEPDSKYVDDGKAHGNVIESGPCSCPTCATDAPSVLMETVHKTGLLNLENDATVPPNLKMSTLETQLGSGRIRSSRNMAGGMVWFNYSETWRIEKDGSPSQYFLADGHVPWRDAPNDDISGQHVGGWSVITFSPNCLTK